MYDLAIIGGGINGCGIARDAAGRGLRVLLVEKGDLAGGTSSASTKLIHGGLRYLEHYEFRLVREALAEREVLWGMAPHIVWPMTFVLPHHAALRSTALIRLGLFLYDHLGGRRLLPASRGLDLRRDAAGLPLQPHFVRGFAYSDCWVEDARLVVLNAVDAAQRGADIRVQTELRQAHRVNGHWSVEVVDGSSGTVRTETARIVVNAAGPWVESVLSRRLGRNARAKVRLVKGSHIVVPRLFAHDHAYLFQNADGRVVFAIPYERDFTLIGTTDVDFTGDPAHVAIDDAETAYLCAAVSAYFKQPVVPSDVVWSYAGVRPLYDDGATAQSVTRDFVLELDQVNDGAPALSIFGGKITTYRRLAEAALSKLAPWLDGAGPAWTKGATLPGGDFPVQGFEAQVAALRGAHGWLAPPLARRLVRAYGTRASTLLAGCRTHDDLGRTFGSDLTEREVTWLIKQEFARSADDVLWRRSKLGLRLTADERTTLGEWISDRLAATATPSPP